MPASAATCSIDVPRKPARANARAAASTIWERRSSPGWASTIPWRASSAAIAPLLGKRR